MSEPVTVARWTDLPLAGDGRCLIEASAGTGKTWTIAALHVRLVLEAGLAPEQIVVTTFGVAASQELRERIRAQLLAATALAAAAQAAGAAAAADQAPAADAVEHWLCARWTDPARIAHDHVRLRYALSELDLAPITTLHGLCGRVLAEHPFESGGSFGRAELVAAGQLDRALRDDTWRALAQGDTAALDAGDRAWFDEGRRQFDKALARACMPGVGVRQVAVDMADVDSVMQPEHARALRDWHARHGATRLAANSVWHRGLIGLAQYIEDGDPYAPWPDKMDMLSQPLKTPFKKAFVDAAAKDEVIAFAQHAVAVLADVPIAARCAALQRHRDALLVTRDRLLRDSDRMTYDALIARTLAALEGPAGDALATCLRAAWPAALVDEFQDTDAQQYAILDRIYRDAHGDPRGRLVMIGDPKQAIYRFRGGDVDAYLTARRSASHLLPLAVNFRSSTQYVGACNDLFALAGRVLGRAMDGPIAVVPVSAHGKQPALGIDGEACERPLVFQVIHGLDEKLAEPRRRVALEACADHIASLLGDGRHRIGGKALAPGDLAVLLPTNRDIAYLRVLLARRRVPCVGADATGIFQTDIAREVAMLLYGIEHAHEEPAVRAALTTRFFGLALAGVRALADDPAAWREHAERFVAWRWRWRSDGVQAVLQSVVAAHARAIAASPGSERTLTDLRHLGELLQQAAAGCDGPASLLAWFARQRAGDDGAAEEASDEQQLRIESDARRVRLMTLHASKGLQFPIVLLPLMWAQHGKPSSLPRVRDAETGRTLIDLGGPLHDRAKQEDAAADEDERFRLLYVALTRARVACHVYMPLDGIDPDAKNASALATLLGRLQGGFGEAALTRGSPHIGWSDTRWTWPQPARVADASARHPERHALPAPPTPPYTARHSFSGLVQPRVASTDDSPAGDEAVAAPDASSDTHLDLDTPAIAAPDEPAHPELAALAALRGTDFGNALHAMLEQRDPLRPLDAQHDLVARCLREAGVRIDAIHDDVARIASRLQAVLATPLAIPGAAPLTLASLDPARQRAEMEFRYALDAVPLKQLRAACAAHGEPDLVPPHAQQVLRGSMTGKIDLVFEHAGRFHVLDWKGNFLGERLGDYAPGVLGAAMDRHLYRFQALLYTIALDRYLRQRKPGYRRDRDLGGALYLFVRAVGLAPGAGVWAHRFDDALVGAVDDVLASAEQERAA